jgi:hydroxyacylglutathione hydrolase
MNKLVKRSLVGLGILIGLLVTGAAVFLINFISATNKMTPSESCQINDSVWCIKDRFVNAYIFKGVKGYIMIDAGISEKRFISEIRKTGIDPEHINTLLLTHTDGDHTGATGFFKNIAVYMHRDEEQMINGTNGKSKFSKTKWKYGPYTLLNSNDSLTIDGLKIKIIHTPGHTPGSSCYMIGDNYLVTGDNLIFKNGKYEKFVEKFNMDTYLQVESLKKLPDPSTFKYILTGHHGIFRDR